MSSMFSIAINFNQDISDWNVSSVASYNNFSEGSKLSSDNLPKFNP